MDRADRSERGDGRRGGRGGVFEDGMLGAYRCDQEIKLQTRKRDINHISNGRGKRQSRFLLFRVPFSTMLL